MFVGCAYDPVMVAEWEAAYAPPAKPAAPVVTLDPAAFAPLEPVFDYEAHRRSVAA